MTTFLFNAFSSLATTQGKMVKKEVRLNDGINEEGKLVFLKLTMEQKKFLLYLFFQNM